MKIFPRLFIAISFIFLVTPSITHSKSIDSNLLYMKLKYGTVVIRMFPDAAPKHVKTIKKLVKSRYFNGLPFYRVATGILAQAGDVSEKGINKKILLKPEISKNLHNIRGAVVSLGPDMQTDQVDGICIWLEDKTKRDGEYTVWGQVISGIEYIEMLEITGIPLFSNNRPDIIRKMYLDGD